MHLLIKVHLLPFKACQLSSLEHRGMTTVKFKPARRKLATAKGWLVVGLGSERRKPWGMVNFGLSIFFSRFHPVRFTSTCVFNRFQQRLQASNDICSDGWRWPFPKQHVCAAVVTATRVTCCYENRRRWVQAFTLLLHTRTGGRKHGCTDTKTILQIIWRIPKFDTILFCWIWTYIIILLLCSKALVASLKMMRCKTNCM